jgi:hypothetical protein
MEGKMRPAALLQAMGLAKEYVVQYWKFNAENNGGSGDVLPPDAIVHTIPPSADNETECMALLDALLGDFEAVTVLPSCYLNGESGKGKAAEFDALVVDTASREVLVAIEMKATFPPRDVQKKVAGLKAARNIQDAGRHPPFRSRDGKAEAYSTLRFHPDRPVPLVYMASGMHACAQEDEIATAVATFARDHPNDALPFFTLGGSYAIDHDHECRKQPHLCFDLQAALATTVGTFDRLRAAVAAIKGYVSVDPDFPFVGIMKVAPLSEAVPTAAAAMLKSALPPTTTQLRVHRNDGWNAGDGDGDGAGVGGTATGIGSSSATMSPSCSLPSSSPLLSSLTSSSSSPPSSSAGVPTSSVCKSRVARDNGASRDDHDITVSPRPRHPSLGRCHSEEDNSTRSTPPSPFLGTAGTPLLSLHRAVSTSTGSQLYESQEEGIFFRAPPPPLPLNANAAVTRARTRSLQRRKFEFDFDLDLGYQVQHIQSVPNIESVQILSQYKIFSPVRMCMYKLFSQHGYSSTKYSVSKDNQTSTPSTWAISRNCSCTRYWWTGWHTS